MSPDGPAPGVSTGQLPDPEHVQAVLDAARAACRDLDEGTVADCVPALAVAPPESPPLDEAGDSVRGQALTRPLSDALGLDLFASQPYVPG